MHKLLERLVRRHRISIGAADSAVSNFISDVDAALKSADEDRGLLEHSLETVSTELISRFDLLQEALAQSTRAQANTVHALSLLEATLEATADGVLVMDLAGKVKRVNRKFMDLWRLPPGSISEDDHSYALTIVLAQFDDPECFLQKVMKVVADQDMESFDVLSLKDGRVFERYSKPQKVADRTIGRVWSFRDITERRSLEVRLQQSQKLQAIGSLAGGIAHDFNNLLTVIQGHADFLNQDSLSAEQVSEVDMIMEAVQKASSLTSRLLAFSRKQILQPVKLEVNSVVEGLRPILRRLIGEDIVVETNLCSEKASILIDRNQLEQVLINLAVNARDAMPHGGKLSISTRLIWLATQRLDSCRLLDDSHERVLMLSVTDTGTGMTAEIRERIFEPFFTTKDVGKGTGLGLATVHGIVEQSGGRIAVESEVGVGTTFFMNFPTVEPAIGISSAAPETESYIGGSETILIAEDEPTVRELARRVLERLGYTVLVAADGEEALIVATYHDGTIDLLVSDVVMPRQGGRALAEELRMTRPHLPILFMSGYTDDEILRRGALDSSIRLLPKPFSPSSLGIAVREAIDCSRRRATASVA